MMDSLSSILRYSLFTNKIIYFFSLVKMLQIEPNFFFFKNVKEIGYRPEGFFRCLHLGNLYRGLKIKNQNFLKSLSPSPCVGNSSFSPLLNYGLI